MAHKKYVYLLVLLISLEVKVNAQTTPFYINGCECSCNYPNFTASNADISKQKALADAVKIERELIVKKSTLSSEYWKKHSVPDSRPSAQGVGSVGVMVLACVCLTIFLWDIPHFIKMLKFQGTIVQKQKHS